MFRLRQWSLNDPLNNKIFNLFYGDFEPWSRKMLNSYYSFLNKLLTIRNYFRYFEIIFNFCSHNCCFFCYWYWYCCCCSCHFSVPEDVYVTVAVSVDAGVDVAIGYCCCSNSSINIFCTIITANIVASVSGDTVNVAKYVFFNYCHHWVRFVEVSDI